MSIRARRRCNRPFTASDWEIDLALRALRQSSHRKREIDLFRALLNGFEPRDQGIPEHLTPHLAIRARYPKGRTRFTEEDLARLKANYVEFSSRGALEELALLMGRSRSFLCKKARMLGLTDQRSLGKRRR